MFPQTEKVSKKEKTLKKTQEDSLIVHFLRASVLLIALIAVPGIAVCWNWLPKDALQKESSKDKNSNNSFVFQEVQLPENQSETSEEKLKEMTENAVIPSSFTDGNNIAAVHFADFSSKTADEFIPEPEKNIPARTVLPERTQRNVSVLETRLRELGVKYHRIEKWGSRGELFRFSCYVSLADGRQCQKFFQAIDSDELNAMETVIDKITQWKTQ